MKSYLLLVVASAFLAVCNNNKSAQANEVAGSASQPQVVSKTEINQSSGDDITGFWKLKLEAYDDNGNKILDEAERKKGFRNNYSFRFNADGSCRIAEFYNGRYEVKTERDKRLLYVYRNKVKGEEKQDPPPDIYRMISMNKNELVLLEDLGNLAFWVFERAN